jgi:hypothetical protein
MIVLPSIEVKPTRRTARKAGAFGVGILASRPVVKAEHTSADEAWYVAQTTTAEDRFYDAMEAEAIALARVDMGLVF